MSPKKLLLIDAYGALYKAFYAIKTLSTKDGRPTNAVYGFIRMLNQMKEEWGPTHWAVVFDGGLPYIRTDALPEYKAQRAPMPDDLREQIPLVDEYLGAASIVKIRVDGQEADDVMASYACRAAEESFDVLVATSDKDLYQIVGENISIVSLSGKAAIMRPEDVKSKTGVLPRQIVDWLALVGDSADNVPGVDGIGPKTAASLLNKFGSIEAMLNGLEKIEREKIRNAVHQSRAILERNKGVVRLNIGLKIERDWDEMALAKPDPARMLKLLSDLEFESMAERFRAPELFS